MARPTKYNEEILALAKDYLANYKAQGDAVPTVAGLSLVLGVTKATIYDWGSQEDKAEFSYTLRDIQAKQESELLNGGLSGGFNSVITKLMLSNHGYSDKSTIEQHTYSHEEALDELD